MTDEEFVAMFGKFAKQVLESRKDSDYKINNLQAARLVDLLNYFDEAAKKLGGNVDLVRIAPREEHSGVTATFVVFYVGGEDVQKFCDVLRFASAISIDSTLDNKVCISVTIPNVFEHK